MCRQVGWVCLDCLLLLALMACGGEAPAAPAVVIPLPEPDYRGLVERYVPAPVPGKRPDYLNRIERLPLRRFCEETAVLARLWRWTGRPEYAEAVRQRLTALVDTWQLQRQGGRPWKRLCFFSVHPVLDAYGQLVASGQLDAAFQDRFRAFAREAVYVQERGPFNQAFARAAGLALAAKTFPDVPEAKLWRAAAEEVWDDWRRQCDTPENAACYNGISLTFLFLLGDALDKSEQFQDPRAKQMLERFRDQVSPLGVVGEYGDSGDAEWGVFHCWGHWAAALERAARDTRDPTYRWAAVRMYHAACGYCSTQKRPSPIDEMNTAFALALADQWRDTALRPMPTEVGSAVTVRWVPVAGQVPDKLLLAPSRRPGVPFAMTELYARSYHAHEEQLGSLLYYEVGDVSLLHGLGYHNRGPEDANLLLMLPPGEAFPRRSQAVTPGVWQEAALPARRLPPLGADPRSPRRRFDKLTFRVAEDEPVDLCLANLRLCGPKGELPLDDFRTPRAWRGGRQSTVAGPAADQAALQISCPRGTSFIWRAGFDREFSLADYDHFKFSWMMKGLEQGWSKSLILRVDDSTNDFHVALRTQGARMASARADARGGDQFGEFEAEDWFTPDTRLVRRLVLLREGPLVVVDQLLPGRQADGWTAGPLWHLRAEPRRGDHWFDAPGSPHLLVWMAPGAGRTVDVQSVELWSGARPWTVFARQPVMAGRTVRMVTVLMPHAATDDAQRLAEGIEAVEAADGRMTVRMKLPQAVEVEIDARGGWSVRRK